MVFRSRRRADMSQAVAEGTERLESLVREQHEALERLQATMLDSVAVTRREMELREGDLVEVLELVSELCRHAIDVVEADREEHREFLASFAEAVRPLDLTRPHRPRSVPVRPGATVFGGTVFAAPVDVDLSPDRRRRASRCGVTARRVRRRAVAVPLTRASTTVTVKGPATSPRPNAVGNRIGAGGEGDEPEAS